ncbi:MAG: RNA polymerase sigma factor [Daejeonella sp.]|uniref:RNA polymerase sigma factor n=1 Tax=Daejeonella sp. JGW-45 TaxID=3034148 RepID=UPI0023EB19A1|nr:RNA polymerase sigma factor [Daejeonella sp. JGW-45]
MMSLVLPIEDAQAVSKKRSRKLRLSEDMLVVGLKNNDSLAMSALYQMYSDSLYKIISTIVVVEEVAQDLLQETFIKIWNSFKMYDASKGRLYTWMARLARNLSIDYLRSSNHRNASVCEDLSEVTQQVDMTFQTNYNPELIGVKEMTRILNKDQKSALELVYFQGYTHVQAAEELNITLGILRSRLQSSLSELRKAYA